MLGKTSLRVCLCGDATGSKRDPARCCIGWAMFVPAVFGHECSKVLKLGSRPDRWVQLCQPHLAICRSDFTQGRHFCAHRVHCDRRMSCLAFRRRRRSKVDGSISKVFVIWRLNGKFDNSEVDRERSLWDNNFEARRGVLQLAKR